jgi:hydroxymethylglutaryl-CoA lyase
MPGDSVKLVECPRDAWQGLKHRIPTERKVNYLRSLIDVGFKHIDAVSFVSPKAVPQMADSEEVLAQLQTPDDVEIIGIVVNEKGAERAVATKRVNTLGFPFSISETFLRKNQNQSPGENLKMLEAIKDRAVEAQLGLVVYVSMAFGNPYQDPWGEAELAAGIRRIVDLGARTISLADTVGMAQADLIDRVMQMVVSEFGEIEIGIHMHSRPSEAAKKVLAAYDAGCRRFDSAIGGLGGCPFAQDALVGNIPTEKVIEALAQRGVDLPLRQSIQGVTELNGEIARSFG